MLDVADGVSPAVVEVLVSGVDVMGRRVKVVGGAAGRIGGRRHLDPAGVARQRGHAGGTKADDEHGGRRGQGDVALVPPADAGGHTLGQVGRGDEGTRLLAGLRAQLLMSDIALLHHRSQGRQVLGTGGT